MSWREMTLIEILKGTVTFLYYRDGSLYYQTDSKFTFSVPVSDTGSGTFLNSDRAILFQRWLRPQWEEARKPV